MIKTWYNKCAERGNNMNNTRPITKHNKVECKSLFVLSHSHTTNAIKEVKRKANAPVPQNITIQPIQL